MNLVQITPGAGGMYCGNCFRDNALVAQLRKMGHHTLMVPLYLPLTLEEEDSSSGTPIFFGGINVYLEQKSSFFRHMPGWLHRLLASPRLLQWASGKAAKTRAEDVGELTLSMFQGSEGNQARELEELVQWLKHGTHPDVICISNALLVGLVRRLRAELKSPVVCMLQGEDAFLDALPESFKAQAWELLAERAREVDLFIAPTRYFAERMSARLGLPSEKVRIVPNGINLDGFAPAESPPAEPTLGYFARMCPEKGLDTLIDSYILLKRRGEIPDLKLRVGGGMGPSDKTFVEPLKRKLEQAGFLHEVSFHPNLSRAEKQEFLRSLSVMSVPALYGEAFGLYVIEAMASGVPVVQPRHAAFPELIEQTGGGVLCEPGNPDSLATAVENLFKNPAEMKKLSEAGLRSVRENFSIERMAERVLKVFQELRH